MESTNSILLNRFFSRNTFQHLLRDGESSTFTAAIRRYVKDNEFKTNEECISEIYLCLKKSYQNEYYYKNTLLNKLLLGVHSLRTTSALTELPVCSSKADFVLINGKAVVYEIKTALDNFERLNGQIKDYYNAFSQVVVVTSESYLNEVLRRIGNSPVGICILTSRGTLSMRKKPADFRDNLSKTAMFKILRKEEYESILIHEFGVLPSVSQFEYYRACQTMFESLRIDVAYELFLTVLKKRTKIDIEEYTRVPYELKFLVYFSNYRERDYIALEHFLTEKGV